jgi:predicted nucleic acid-binding protein
MKAYLDNNVVSSIVRDDNESQSAAITRLLEAGEAGKVQVVTSELTLEEIRNAPQERRPPLERIFRLLDKVPIVRWEELVFLRPTTNTKPMMIGPVPLSAPLYDKLLGLGLEVTDARHLFVAAEQRCDAFLTCDNTRRTGILRRAPDIRTLTGMAVQRPTEFLVTQGW